MTKKILVPDFTRGKEPTLKSTRKKNEDGLCCYHSCQNKLSDNPHNGIWGFKVCDECKKSDDELRDQIEKEIMDEWTGYIGRVIKQVNEI